MDAWSKALDQCQHHMRLDGPSFDEIKAYAPGLAKRIDETETAANEASVAFVSGVGGMVQVRIDVWRDAWIEAINLVRDARCTKNSEPT